jgi:hypothetical protein
VAACPVNHCPRVAILSWGGLLGKQIRTFEMNIQVATIPEIISRGGTYILLLCILLLECTEVMTLVPLDHRRIAYRAAMELICIIVLLRLEDSSFVRDMIDIQAYLLLFKLCLLLAYFAYSPLYTFIRLYLIDQVMTAAFMLFITRIVWVSQIDGKWVPGRWPVIGVHGWRMSKQVNFHSVGTRERVMIGVATLFCAAIGFAFGAEPNFAGWLIGAFAVTGILTVAIYAKPLSTALQTLLMTSEERHNVIMQYEDVIINSKAALDELRKLEKQAEPKPERQNVVRLVKNTPDVVAEPDEKSAGKDDGELPPEQGED